MAKQFRTVYDSPYNTGFDANAFRKVAFQDPQFALGEAIGRGLADAYANNYNNRGINKAVDKALADYQNQEGQQAVSEVDALNNVRQNLGLEDAQAQPVISVGNVPQQDQQLAIERLAAMPGASIVAQSNAATKMEPFNAKEAMLKARQQMINDGRTPYQIEQAMSILEPQFAKMQDDSYRNEVERIMAGLQNKDTDSLDYKKTIIDMASNYGDIGKNAANLLGKDIVSGQQQWMAEQQLEREGRKAAIQQAQKDQEMALRERLADKRIAAYIAKSNNSGNGTGTRTGNKTAAAKSPLASEEFKYIENALKAIDEIPEEDRTPQQKQFYGTYKPLRDEIVRNSIGGAFGYYGAPAQQKGTAASGTFNPNDYNQAVSTFRKFAQRGNYRKEDVAKYIRQKYGLKPDDTSNDFVESIIREL